MVSFLVRSRNRETGKKVEEERKEKQREREREEEKEESGGGMQRGKWCSKKPTSTLD